MQKTWQVENIKYHLANLCVCANTHTRGIYETVKMKDTKSPCKLQIRQTIIVGVYDFILCNIYKNVSRMENIVIPYIC